MLCHETTFIAGEYDAVGTIEARAKSKATARRRPPATQENRSLHKVFLAYFPRDVQCLFIATARLLVVAARDKQAGKAEPGDRTALALGKPMQ